MSYRRMLSWVFGITLVVMVLTACAAATPTPVPPTSTLQPTPTSIPTPVPESLELWEDATDDTIGITGEWTNKVELADLNGDGLVDILLANGGEYQEPGDPEPSRVFLNQGPGQMFEEVTESIFGPEGMLVRAIKVRDVSGDGHPDIMAGASFQTQSRFFLGDGQGNFTDVTATNLPQVEASIGDLEFGDVDGDGDLDVLLADWGPGDPQRNGGERTMLWLNDGTGNFSDATDARMPDVKVGWSWELEFVDVDNDYDLDILISCKSCLGSFLFENDGTGMFTDVTAGRLPQFSSNYDFEAMDLNSDGFLDLVTINDGVKGPLGKPEHIFLNDGQGGFEDATDELWPESENEGYDDNMAVFLDFDSDGDADLLIGSLQLGPDRLLVNDGSGHLQMIKQVFVGEPTHGTLGISVADLNSDGKLDVVQGQGEVDNAYDDRVFLGRDIEPDTAPPIITMVEEATATADAKDPQVRARVHDNKSPTGPYDWQSVVLRWTANGKTQESPMRWYGEYLWRGTMDAAATDALGYQVCATDAAGNEACSPL